MAGRAKAAPVLRKNEEKKEKLFKSAKWSDVEDDNEKEYGEEEVARILKEAGLPHMQRPSFTPEKPKPELKEMEEGRDPVYEHGSDLARVNNGRGALPRRLNYRERSNHQVYEW